MNRCPISPTGTRRCALFFIASRAVLAGATATFGLISLAQEAPYAGRNFPEAAKRATLVVTAAPEIELNGKPDRLSPGARIRGTNNMLVMTGAITGQELPVRYVRDAAGLVHEAWVLTPEEAAQRRPGEGGGWRGFFSFGAK